MVRTNTELVSGLLDYHFTDDHGDLVTWCPREDCPSYQDEIPFVVNKDLWIKQQMARYGTDKEKEVTGRACPYCFRPSRIPKELIAERDGAKKR